MKKVEYRYSLIEYEDFEKDTLLSSFYEDISVLDNKMIKKLFESESIFINNKFTILGIITYSELTLTNNKSLFDTKKFIGNLDYLISEIKRDLDYWDYYNIKDLSFLSCSYREDFVKRKIYLSYLKALEILENIKQRKYVKCSLSLAYIANMMYNEEEIHYEEKDSFIKITIPYNLETKEYKIWKKPIVRNE